MFRRNLSEWEFQQVLPNPRAHTGAGAVGVQQEPAAAGNAHACCGQTAAAVCCCLVHLLGPAGPASASHVADLLLSAPLPLANPAAGKGYQTKASKYYTGK